MAQINQNSVCLISGGGRGITAQTAIALAQEYRCKFILLGRSTVAQPEPEWAHNCDDEIMLKKRILEHLLQETPKPTPVMVQREYKTIAAKREIEQTLQKITQAGGLAEYFSLDVTDRATVTAQLAIAQEKVGRVNVIIHGAGNLADKPIEKKSLQDFETVYAPKVKGLENLLQAVDPSHLDAVVLFSSVVGFYGNAGQTDYAIANDILNKTAYTLQQQYPQAHVVAINWGPWDSGMVSPQLKKAFAERGIKTIPIDVGTQMLVNELAPANPSTTQVVIGSLLKAPALPVSPEAKSDRIHRRLSLTANPFLQDHVIMERPVLPATCAISWIANNCEQIYPGYQFFSCHDFKVLKGIVFDQNLADEYILDLDKKSVKDENCLDFDAKIWSRDKAGKVRYHFSSKLKLVNKIEQEPYYKSLSINQENLNLNHTDLYQKGDKSLFHGASFQGVKSILNISPQKLTVECYLPQISLIQQGQFAVQTFNPYLVDVQIHSLWLWLQYNHQEICLPSEIISYEQFSILPFDQTFYVSCEVKNKTKTAVVADIITHDREGKIYSQMLGSKGTIISF